MAMSSYVFNSEILVFKKALLIDNNGGMSQGIDR